jgi:hypothetical protein
MSTALGFIAAMAAAPTCSSTAEQKQQMIVSLPGRHLRQANS